MLYEELWEPQKALFNRIESNWNHGDPVVVQAGQRSGKTTISRALLEKREPVHAMVFAATREQALVNYPELPRSPRETHNWFALGVGAGANYDREKIKRTCAKYANAGKLNSKTLVIIEEVFWISGGEFLFDELSKYTPFVLAQSSKGKYRWKSRERILRYSTWDLNPNLTRAALALAFRDDPNRAERDFGNQEP